MSEQTAIEACRQNARRIRCSLCTCGSVLTEWYDESVPYHWRVVCASDHTHKGVMSKAGVERRRLKSKMEGLELRKVFPELSGYTEPTQAEIDKDFADLFG